MCGINGIYAYHYAAGPIDPHELACTRDHMAARGPDGAGAWASAEGRIGLGHRRLAIIDLSDAGAQPMASDKRPHVISFNGEIYNHHALRRGLEARGHAFKSQSDTEVLLALYAEKGAAMVRDLRGMFAFAIWDGERRCLFLARDPYGIKPLYVCDDGWTFRFASQVKALLAGGKVSRDPEPAGLIGFHIWGHVPEPFTLYREIRALPAGHTQIIDSTGPREPQRFASISETLAKSSGVRVSPEEAAALVARGTRDSVAHHLVADVEVGVFLSAGVDSGAILGLVRDAGVHNPLAITLGFDEFAGTDEDEAPLAALVASHFGARHIVRRVNRTEFDADLPAILHAMDQPSIDGINTWFVAKAAREAGLKVALSGLGGDELLAGYPSFTDLPRWRRRLGFATYLPGAGSLARATLRLLAPGFATARPKSLHMLDHAGTWEGAYLLRRGLHMPAELAVLLDPDVVREGLYRLRPLERVRATLSPDPGSDNGRVCALESCHYMRDQLLRDSDWAGMAHGLEIRTPLVDAALFETLAPVIPTLTAGAGKRALAAAPSRALPDSVANRAKTGFAVPTAQWMDKITGAAEGRGADALPPKGVASRRWSRRVLDGIDGGRFLGLAA